MSEIRANTVSDAAGTGPATLTGQSAAKVWWSKNAAGTALNDSFNVSSLDDDGTGDYGINFTNTLDSADYGSGSSGETGGVGACIQTINASSGFSDQLQQTDAGSAADRIGAGCIFGTLA